MSEYSSNPTLSQIFATQIKPLRPKIFVSYHHGGDQSYYDEFSRFFHNQYEAIRDNSLERCIQSDDVDYVMRNIREDYITGTSCTIVLIGAQSYQRKYLDWEIKATLDKYHGLVGIVLPNHVKNIDGAVIVPDRFLDNYKTGYTTLVHWNGLTAQTLQQLIGEATDKSKLLINNARQTRHRNG